IPWVLAMIDKKLKSLDIEKKVAQDLFNKLNRREDVDERTKSVRKKKVDEELAKKVKELENMRKELMAYKK
ncbi:MAG: hypothetical protein ACE5IF_04625, partial [Candidatus Bathyarchaeia archaeon]